MTPYSEDLRQRILETVERGEGSLRQIARRFLVSLSFVTRLLQLHRSTGSLQPRPHGGGNPAKLGPQDLERLRELVEQQPDATLEELRQRLGVSCSTMTIARPAQAEAPAQEEDPSRPGAGPAGRPGETAGILRGTGRRGPATAGLRR
jgi:transposase